MDTNHKKIYFTILNPNTENPIHIRQVYLLEISDRGSNILDPVVTKRQDLGKRLLKFDRANQVPLISIDSIVSIPGNSIAGYLFEYTNIEEQPDGKIVHTFKINPDKQIDYVISKINLAVEFYDVENSRVDTLSVYIFSRIK